MDPASTVAFGPLDTWDRLLDALDRVAGMDPGEERLDRLAELLVNLRLLGQEERIPDRRGEKDDIEGLHARVRDAVERALGTLRDPDPALIHLLREVLKKLPVRASAADLIEDIRSAAEAFDELREEDDPLRSFAGDLRKETHRRLSPRILDRYVLPYLDALEGRPDDLAQAGYPIAAARFRPADEDPRFVDLARELHGKLSYLWDYAGGDVAQLRDDLAGRGPLFQRCFLTREVQAVLSMLQPSVMAGRLALFDLLKRLASIQGSLRQSFGEGRLGLYEYLLVDLDVGRLLFIASSDLANHHFAEVGARDRRDALALVRELLAILAGKRLSPGRLDGRIAELDALRDEAVPDLPGIRRCLQGIAEDLQEHLQTHTIARLGRTLNRVLEAYQVPTTRLSPAKTRFFNNFVRRTHFHVLTEFVEKVLASVDAELALQQGESQMYGRWRVSEWPRAEDGDLDRFVASTWTEPDEGLRPFLGGKGNSLIDLARLDLPVPAAFVLGLPLCDRFLDETRPESPRRELLDRWIAALEQRTGRRLGDPDAPLLVSVRSGAVLSLPGSMMTILNVGQTPAVLEALAARHGAGFARGIRYRFLRGCLLALRGPGEPGPAPLGTIPPERRSEAVAHMAAELAERAGPAFLDDPREQVRRAVAWVFASSQSPEAQASIRALAVDRLPGTAVTVQQMVFGNRDDRSLSGVLLTRNPVTGSDELFGEFQREVQGEDVVMGHVVPRPIDEIDPDVEAQLLAAKQRLETFFPHELNIEFTVESGELWLLQARRARMGAYASLAVDLDFLRRGRIDAAEFRQRLERLGVAHDFVTLPQPDPLTRSFNPPVAEGVPIVSGVVSGTLVLTPTMLQQAAARRETIIYLAYNTRPADFALLNAAHAIVNVFPGRTSHAAITAMALNKPCIVGVSTARIDLEQRRVTFQDRPGVALHEGERITIDANTGALYRGPAPLSHAVLRVSALLHATKAAGTPQEIVDLVSASLKAQQDSIRRETTFQRRTISTRPRPRLAGRNVLVRADLNVPMHEGRITDAIRIEQAIPTLRLLLEHGATPVVCTHLGDPGAGASEARTREEIYALYSLRTVADRLAEAFPGRLVFHEKSIATSGLLIPRALLVPGAVNVLENLRFAGGEKENDELFARSLAQLADDLYVNDAFNVCHRRHASITGVPAFARERLAGPLVARELAFLEKLLVSPRRPFVAIMGGDKVSTKIGILETLLLRVDALAVGGAVGYTLMDAAGRPIGRSRADTSLQEVAAALLARHGDKVRLPVDFVLDPRGDRRDLRPGYDTIPDDGESVDLGPRSVDRIRRLVEGAGTVLWDGPLGVYESPEAARATEDLARLLADAARRGTTVVVCGGDTGSAVRRAGVARRLSHVSTGGAAFLEFLDRLSLPGITALDPA